MQQYKNEVEILRAVDFRVYHTLYRFVDGQGKEKGCYYHTIYALGDHFAVRLSFRSELKIYKK